MYLRSRVGSPTTESEARVIGVLARDLGASGQTCSFLVSTQMMFPWNSFPQRPARPARFQKSPADMTFPRPFLGPRAKRFRHGRLTPSRRVEVQTRYRSTPSRNSFSISA